MGWLFVYSSLSRQLIIRPSRDGASFLQQYSILMCHHYWALFLLFSLQVMFGQSAKSGR